MQDGYTRVPATPSVYALSPGSTALVVIDMQRDFLQPGGFGSALGHDVTRLHTAIEPIATLLDAWRSRGWPVLHSREAHPADRFERAPSTRRRADKRPRIGDTGRLGRHLIAGELGAEFIPELAPLPGELVIDAPGKGMFWSTGLHEALQDHAITHLVFAGVTTESGVEASMREAADRGYASLLVEDATESYDPVLKAATLAMLGARGASVGSHALSAVLLRELRRALF
jgi:nicotinamidase-related amidase